MRGLIRPAAGIRLAELTGNQSDGEVVHEAFTTSLQAWGIVSLFPLDENVLTEARTGSGTRGLGQDPHRSGLQLRRFACRILRRPCEGLAEGRCLPGLPIEAGP